MSVSGRHVSHDDEWKLPSYPGLMDVSLEFKFKARRDYLHKLSSIFIMCLSHSKSRLCKMTWDSSTSINLDIHSENMPYYPQSTPG